MPRISQIYEIVITMYYIEPLKIGEIKIFDMKNLINNIEFYKKLKNKDYFKKVKPYNETVIWENGEDVCPEDLYYNSVEIKYKY